MHICKSFFTFWNKYPLGHFVALTAEVKILDQCFSLHSHIPANDVLSERPPGGQDILLLHLWVTCLCCCTILPTCQCVVGCCACGCYISSWGWDICESHLLLGSYLFCFVLKSFSYKQFFRVKGKVTGRPKHFLHAKNCRPRRWTEKGQRSKIAAWHLQEAGMHPLLTNDSVERAIENQFVLVSEGDACA